MENFDIQHPVTLINHYSLQSYREGIDAKVLSIYFLNLSVVHDFSVI